MNPVLAYDHNHLTFHYSAVDWLAPHKLKYSYRLKGLNDNWNVPTDETKADYRNLPYGSFTFEVMAIGESQRWSEPFSYSFTISPPWWHTWWARIAYVLIAIVLVSGVVKWRTNKLRKRQEELEREIDIATEEIREQKATVEQQHAELEETHQEISNSIRYAEQLQLAILPSEEALGDLGQSFVWFQPKDVVSGDFYWMQNVDGTLFFAAADCTGHGVPGAMVSVVCSNALNRSVKEFGLSSPKDILDKTREQVIETFSSSGKEVKDGMDIALCKLENGKLTFAGANNPLWIVRKAALLTEEQKQARSTVVEGNLALIEFKGDKQPIGLYLNMKGFTETEVNLFEGDTLYLFSDGFCRSIWWREREEAQVQTLQENSTRPQRTQALPIKRKNFGTRSKTGKATLNRLMTCA